MVTGRPVVGVSALDALALTAFEQLGRPRARIGCWTDAARGEVFAALYDVERGRLDGPALTALTPPEVGLPPAIWSRWHTPRPDSHRHAWATRPFATPISSPPRHAGAGRLPLLAPAIARLGRRLAREAGLHLPHTPAAALRSAPRRRASPAARPIDAVTDFPRVEPLAGPADLDGVLAIEEASFNNPTTRAWYEAELAAPGGLQGLRHPDRGHAGGGLRRLLAGAGRDAHQQSGRPPGDARTRTGPVAPARDA